MKNRKAQKEWHDKDLTITKYGLNMMRILLITGAVLGFLLGYCTSYLII